MSTTRPRLLTVAIAAALISAACGGSNDPGADGTRDDEEVTSTTSTSEPDTGDDGPAPIGSFDAAQPAVVQIVAQGSFRDPEVGMVTTAGAGSGFLISADGYAVTNNHVVTGAATLEVFLGDDAATGYNATVIGVSECNDLALIKLSTSDEVPFLEWSDVEAGVGTEVYAAGFPLGDPEYTLTRGIVAKANADGDSPWASIDSTIEHDANIQPGNSGGPLIDADGRVVAVNYAAYSPTNQSQYFAISAHLAAAVVDELHDGDFESLGINGTAVADSGSGLAGIWVAGVAAGSPAASAGILPGDIVLTLNGLPVGSDGTMADYCDVLRTAGDRPIAVEVLRFDTEELLRGEIGGDKPLEAYVSFAEEIDDDVDVDDSGDVAAYSGATLTLIDDTYEMTVDVPAEWSDIDTTPLVGDDGTQTPWISASVSLDGMFASYDTPGMFMIGLPFVDDDEITAAMESFAPSADQCATDTGTDTWSDDVFIGRYQLWDGCGAAGGAFVLLVANSTFDDAAVLIGVQMVTAADVDALDIITSTFNYL